MPRPREGFTLIELMIVVAIIGILAAIALPKMGELIRKSGEGTAKGNLGTIRSALNLYYGDNEGSYPSGLSSLTVAGKYLSDIPKGRTPNYHPDTSAIRQAPINSPDDANGWLYDNTPGGVDLGTLVVNCTHTDSKGSLWTSY